LIAPETKVLAENDIEGMRRNKKATEKGY